MSTSSIIITCETHLRWLGSGSRGRGRGLTGGCGRCTETSGSCPSRLLHLCVIIVNLLMILIKSFHPVWGIIIIQDIPSFRVQHFLIRDIILILLVQVFSIRDSIGEHNITKRRQLVVIIFIQSTYGIFDTICIQLLQFSHSIISRYLSIIIKEYIHDCSKSTNIILFIKCEGDNTLRHICIPLKSAISFANSISSRLVCFCVCRPVYAGFGLDLNVRNTINVLRICVF